MLVIGLTGSIGMGKTATAEIFRAYGIPVHDSDKAVHELYRREAVGPVARLFPSVIDQGSVDRTKLAQLVLSDPNALKKLEAVIHPLVSEHRKEFIRGAHAEGATAVVCDVPLLFETGVYQEVDAIVVVSAPSSVQKARVLARTGMTQARFDAILAKQMPDLEKRRRAHAIIETGCGFDIARRQVAEFLRAFAGKC